MTAIRLNVGDEPLRAAAILLATIESPFVMGDQLLELCHSLDAYIYAVGFLDSPGIGYIESVDRLGIEKNDPDSRKRIAENFPQLGFYWQALDTEIVDGTEGKLCVGDAIDDLLDIVKELREVAWFDQHHGKNEALAALRFRHSIHLYMHVFPLRLYLSEKIRNG